ncbi:receptor-type tyrosine-protein phosphatase T isoform X2 [Nematostella vectensis]|uniref:receptor-type tyrosine-protein phosphatase T isoform X2 n=1 Tax=Nematostella vectensis TaxID=45351 RepID=UPI0020774B43|nr:receptor-type tyrosine-protein phosphatase T isoform X2 [Nematostella vectensis]
MADTGMYFFIPLAFLLQQVIFTSGTCGDPALGMQNGNISDNKITNERRATIGDQARLDYTTKDSWCTTRLPGPFIQIDLRTPHIICGVATQGNHKQDQWVEKFLLRYSSDDNTYIDYRENGRVRTFYGNQDRDGKVHQILYNEIVARFVRIIPLTFHARACMRAEIYGVIVTPACGNQAIGVTDEKVISDDKMTASSYLSGFMPSRARLHGAGAWKPGIGDSGPWLQVHLGAMYHVCAVATQGSPKDEARARNYMTKVSPDGNAWTDIDDVMAGNRDRNGVVKHPVSAAAMFVRFYPLEISWASALRVEIYGVQTACSNPLGMEDGRIPDDKISSSSSKPAFFSSNGRLYGASTWCKGDTLDGQYIQVDLGHVMTVVGIATQGDPTGDNWVMSYIVWYSIDDKTWIDYKDRGAAKVKVFTGNEDRTTVKVNWFDVPVAVRYIRVFPVTSQGSSCLRMELYGCKSYIALTVDRLNDSTLPAKPGSQVSLDCTARGYGEQMDLAWIWQDFDITVLSRGTTRTFSQATSTLRVNYTDAEDVFKSFSCLAPSPGGDIPCSVTYSCFASYKELPGGTMNSSGVSVKTTLRLPGVPYGLSSHDVKPRSIIFTWKTPAKKDGEGSVTSYKLELMTTGKILNTGRGDLYLKVDELLPYKEYKFRVKAVSQLGEGPWSAEATVRTKQDAPSAPPQNVTISQSEDGNHTISWQPIPAEQSNGIIMAYEITWIRTANQKTRVRRAAMSSAVTSDTSYTLTDLPSCYVYNVSVRGFTAAGQGPFTRPIRLNTNYYGIPKKVSVIWTMHEEAGLSWTKPDQEGPGIISYKIYVSGVKPYDRTFNHSLTIQQTSIITASTLTRLVPGTRYEFRVRAMTECGEGRYSEPVSADTAIDDPLAPDVGDVLLVNETEEGKANITVWPARQRNGPISFYQVLVVSHDGESVISYTTAQLPFLVVGEAGLNFTLGDGRTYDGVTNTPLVKGRTYRIYERAMTKTSTKTYIGEEALIANITTEEYVTIAPAEQTGGGVGPELIVYILVPLVIIVLVVIVIVCLKRRKSSKKSQDMALSNTPKPTDLYPSDP